MWVFLLAFSLEALVSQSGQARGGEPSETQRVIPADVKLPSRLALVEHFTPGRGPLIFHIQTVHGSYEAQMKIAALLHEIDRRYGMDLLLLENSCSISKALGSRISQSFKVLAFNHFCLMHMTME